MTALRTVLLGCLLGGVFLSTAGGAEPTRLSADIGPRPLAEALDAFGRQTGLQLIYVSSVAETQQSKGAPAGLTAPAALTQLLDGTGLTFEFLNARTVRIFPAPTVVPTLMASSAMSPRRAVPSASGLEEVLVNGTRGLESLSRVPIDMVVWTQDAMEASGVKGIVQIGALTPGVDFSFTNGLGGDYYTHLYIRGVSNRNGAAVGIYLDDTPIPPAYVGSYLRSFPAAFDLDRVEILRGPQAVLLGDHTQGGAIRFIANQPSLTTYTGHARAEWGATEYGGMSYESGAAVGGPILTDVLGFRVSGWLREDGGYVDRVDPNSLTLATVDANANRYVSKVAQAALLFAPTHVQVTPAVFYESVHNHDTSTFFTNHSDPGHGVFKNAYLLQQPYDDRFYVGSLKITAHGRFADLNVRGSYFERATEATVDVSPVPPAEAAYLSLKQRAYSGELRLTSPYSYAPLNWFAGVLVSRERARGSEQYPSPVTEATVTDQSQLAGFGQIELKVAKHLAVSVGLRVGRSGYESFNEASPPFQARASDTWVAPRFGLSWQADEHSFFYLTAAKGYGSGGTVGLPSEPPQPYPPEELMSYEIGSKHVLLNSRLRLETGFFHILWNNGQYVSYPPTSFSTPGTAVSNGFDLTARALVGEHGRVAVAVAYTDAHFTQTLTSAGEAVVREGDSLGGSPWNVTASLERDFPLREDVVATVRVEDVFRSASGLPVPNDAASAPDPRTNRLNIRACVNWPTVTAAVMLSNALGSQPTLATGLPGAFAYPGSLENRVALTLTPRTLSVSGTCRF